MKLPANVPVQSYAAEALVPLTPEVKDLLTLTNKFGEPYTLYRHEFEGSPKVFVPRGLVNKNTAPNYTVVNPVPNTPAIKPPQTEEQGKVIADCLELLQSGVDHVVEAPTGFGKCRRKGSKIIMFDGFLRSVEDVQVGDLLLGPDSQPRKVQAIGGGYGKMFKITPKNEEPFWVNEDHILSLKCTGGAKFGGFQKGDVLNISVKEYLTRSKTFKHCFKLWKPNGVDFGRTSRLPIDPYVLGLMLGDGCMVAGKSVLTSADPVLADALKAEAVRHGCHVVARHTTSKAMDYFVLDGRRDSDGNGSNAFIDQLRNMGVYGKTSGDKAVPKDYLLASREERLQLLAGLLDTDGHLVEGTVFEFVSKSRQLALDLMFLVRSIGLAAKYKEVEKACANNGKVGTYFRVHVSGHTDSIPTRLLRKQAKPRQQVKDVLVTGFTVEEDGEDFYYGFTLDKDHLYLADSFIVDHNTYVGCSVAGKLGQKTLIIVTKNDLIKGWKDTLVHLFGVNPSEIGHVQQDTAKFHNCRFVVAMVHSLICRDYDPSLYQSFGLVIFDEVHRLGADYFAQVCSRFPSRHRLGLSATPTRSDGKEKLFTAHIGPVMVRGSWVPMNPKIIVKQTGWKVPVVAQRGDDGVWKKMPMKLVPGRMMPVTKAIASDFTRNKEIAHFVKSAYDGGRHVLVMSDLIDDHLQPLFHMFVAEGIPGNDIAYYHGQVKKEQLEVAKTKRVVLATYLMCGEGTNVPHWDTLVLATPRSNVKQAVGRVLRKVEGKKQPVVLDLVDNHEILKTFYFSRLKQYYSVGAEIVQV